MRRCYSSRILLCLIRAINAVYFEAVTKALITSDSALKIQDISYSVLIFALRVDFVIITMESITVQIVLKSLSE